MTEHEHHEHHAEHHAHAHHEKKGPNAWMITTVIFAIALIAVGTLALTMPKTAVNGSTPGQTGANLDANKLANKGLNYLKTNIFDAQGVTVSLASVEKINDGLILANYKLSKDGQIQDVPAYLTADGKKLIAGQVLDLETPIPQQPPVDTQNPPVAQTIAKSDKASGELYIFSYCPAGTAALDSFTKAAQALKNVADVKVKFFSNMHGAHEEQQNMIQECMQKVAKDKYWDYASQYVAKIYNVCGSTKDIACDKTESEKLMTAVGIDSKAVFDCVDKDGAALYAADQKDAIALSLQYSPSIVVNGVYLGNSADRTPEGIKKEICSAFNTAPAICDQNLSSTGAATTGNC